MLVVAEQISFPRWWGLWYAEDGTEELRPAMRTPDPEQLLLAMLFCDLGEELKGDTTNPRTVSIVRPCCSLQFTGLTLAQIGQT